MTAVILAAGMGTRLRPRTNDLPKALLEVGGKPLLRRCLESVAAAGVTRVVVVTGYLHEMVEEYLAGLSLSCRKDTIFNPQYASTSNNYSLSLAGPEIAGEELLLLDSDILFAPGILRLLMNASSQNALVVRRTGDLGSEEIKVLLDGDGRVLRIGREIDPVTAQGESVGIERFSAKGASALFSVLEKRRSKNELYEASFQQLIDDGVQIHGVDSGGLPCIEIDTPEDLRSAERLAAEHGL